MKYENTYTACPACGDKQIQLLIKDFRGNQIFRCRACSVQFMNPVYADAYLADYYAGYYGGGESGQDIAASQERTNRAKQVFIDRYFERPGRVLDFGCGNGNFADFAMRHGWQVVGYDVDCDAMARVSDRLKINIACGPLDGVDWQDQKFDLIHAHHVVEHLKHPVRDLKILANLLVPGGYIYIGVPNIHAWSARVKYLMEKLGLKRGRVGKYYDSDHHVFYYSPQSMRRLLELCGFEMVLSMNGAKSTVGNARGVRYWLYRLQNLIYSSSSFFVIARKKV
ncbi:MAG: class I SAM-dependent methyltransferase [Gammaproteobacteria bacterium]|nr:class I SAM-dependent methyltransferase [Gammaproteobacteria bacterium]